MTILLFLAPASLMLALIGLGAFLWTVQSGQYDDPAGDAARILLGADDDRPLPDAPPADEAPRP
jgi:cbb3-type cytochrome oxidase maturation protein